MWRVFLDYTASCLGLEYTEATPLHQLVDLSLAQRTAIARDIAAPYASKPTHPLVATLPDHIFGLLSCRGEKYGRSGARSRTNQDRGCVVRPFGGNEHGVLACVFDGHGLGGQKVAEFMMHTIPRLLEERIKQRHGTAESLVWAFEKADALLTSSPSIASHRCGCTGIVVLINDDGIWTANVGDSRAVLGCLSADGGNAYATPLSEDQKPDTPGEIERLHAAGAIVTAPTELNVARVWSSTASSGSCGLAMSRSLGDGIFRSKGVIPTPVISLCEHQRDIMCVVIASDGVWEFITNEQAVAAIQECGMHAGDSCTQIVREAIEAWDREEEGNYRDDITVIVVKMPHVHPLDMIAPLPTPIADDTPRPPPVSSDDEHGMPIEASISPATPVARRPQVATRTRKGSSWPLLVASRKLRLVRALSERIRGVSL